MTLSDKLQDLLKQKGASLVGFADLREIPPNIKNGLPFGVSITVSLNARIIADIQDGPTKQYYEEYQRANNLLDTLGQSAVNFLEQWGHKARWLAATNVGIDPQTLSTILPHKTVATRAGLGWIGRCALLVTEEFGSAVRLTTVLTDAPIATGQPVNASMCGDCTACVFACPGHAISGEHWQAGIPRESLYNAFACRQTSREFALKTKGIHDNICGVCIAACPWTKKYLERAC